MKRVDVSIDQAAPDAGAILIFPRPFQHWNQKFVGLELENLELIAEKQALNSDQTAYIAKASNGTSVSIGYDVKFEQADASAKVWEVQSNKYNTASPELVDLARDISSGVVSETDKVRALIEYAAGMFGYDHPEDRFYDGLDSVPAICGTTKGNCVDINTFLLAAARSLGVKAQYIAGYWFHPKKIETLDMHCWLAFRADDKLLFWDLAHHLKWGVAELAPGLNPAGGRRIAMSCGRGLKFETPNGVVEISHFSEPVWVMPDGSQIRPDLRAKVTD